MLTIPTQLDKLVGLAMLVAASVVFLYYSIWTLLMVKLSALIHLHYTHPNFTSWSRNHNMLYSIKYSNPFTPYPPTNFLRPC